jgi:hypothetical protein
MTTEIPLQRCPWPKYLFCLNGLLVLALSSCSKPQDGGANGTAASHAAKPPDMAVAFAAGRELTNELGHFTLKIQRLPELIVTSGKVIACDAFVFEDVPLKEKLPPGKYQVILSIAQFSNDQRVACAQLQVSTNPPVKWQLGSSYGVDSGTGCFMDQDAGRLMEKKLAANPNSFNDVIKAMEKTYQPTWSWGNIILNPASGLNQIAFSSGFGDGGYDTFVGYDSADKIACIVTDFGIINP